MLTQDRLKQLLHYNPDTGDFRWLERPGNPTGWHKSREGTVAGRVMKRRIPYLQIRVDDRQYYAHRLAFLYMTGEWPEHYVDHIDGDGLNNRWDNLRGATNAQNQHNAKNWSTNTTGFKGVCFAKDTGKYQAQITQNKKAIYLGQYDTPEEAHAAYRGAAELLRGEFARTE